MNKPFQTRKSYFLFKYFILFSANHFSTAYFDQMSRCDYIIVMELNLRSKSLILQYCEFHYTHMLKASGCLEVNVKEWELGLEDLKDTKLG